MVSFGTVQKKTYELIDTGEYVFTLQDVGEITGDYGDRMQWDFLIAEKDTPTEYFARNDGSARVLRFWTDRDIILGSKQHQWMQALAGRQFGEGDDLPDGGELLSKRMLAYLTHYTPKKGKNAGVAKEDIVMGSAKPFSLGGRKNGAASQPSPTQVTAEPSDEDVDRALLVAKLEKQIARLKKLDEEAGAAAQAAYDQSDLGTAPMEAIEDLVSSVQHAINAALEE